MTKIKLIRSGGFIGKALSAVTVTDIDENEIMDALKGARTISDKKAKDAFSYLIKINDGENIPVDISKIKIGKIKTVIESKLLNNLKA